MDPSTKTTLLLVLGLACVATLVLLLKKESEEQRGVQPSASVRGSHHCGGVRQVPEQITLEWQLTNSREDPEEWSQPF